MPARILIADDHGIIRAGLGALLSAEPGLEVIGEANTGEEAVHLAAELRPDLVLMDLSMPGMGGLEATRRIRESMPEVQVLILTIFEDIGLVREAVRIGAGGYILKRAVKTELISAVRSILGGDMYIHPAMMRSLLAEPQPAAAQSSSEGASLTPREIEVLRLIAQGHTNNQIAAIMSISVRTVEYHRANLTGKLNLRSRVDLIRYAAEHGIT